MDAMSAAATDQSKLPRAMFVFNLHMGMGEIHWREEGDPIMYRLKKRDIFLCKRYFFSTFLVATCFYLVWGVEWDRVSIWFSYLQNPTMWVFSILSPDFTMVGIFRLQILPHFVLKPYVCRCRYPTSERVFFSGIVGCSVGQV
jgi:hypothetical protein